jgi:hypothetical protein
LGRRWAASDGGLKDEVEFESVASSSRPPKQDPHRGGIQQECFLDAIPGSSLEEMHGPVSFGFYISQLLSYAPFQRQAGGTHTPGTEQLRLDLEGLFEDFFTLAKMAIDRYLDSKSE